MLLVVCGVLPFFVVCSDSFVDCRLRFVVWVCIACCLAFVAGCCLLFVFFLLLFVVWCHLSFGVRFVEFVASFLMFLVWCLLLCVA